MTLRRIALLACLHLVLINATHAGDNLMHGLTNGFDDTLLGFNETFLAECHVDIDCHCVGHAPGDCVADCDDCTGYYICLRDHYEHKNCPIGEIYYPITQTCAPGKCPRIDCNLPTPPTPPTPPQTPPTTTTTTTTLPPPPECPERVPICDYDGEILPDPKHCTYFWTCVNGCAVLGFCNRGMWYDPVKRVCDYQQNVLTCTANKD